MNPESLILFPVTHEQTLPTFHVRDDLHARFVKLLGEEAFQIAELPEHMEGTDMTEVLLDSGTSVEKLRGIKERFLASVQDE